MAKMITEDTEMDPIFASYSIWRTCIIGAVMGVLYWGLTEIVNLVFNSINVAGDIATVLVATLGILTMVRLRMAQPLIIALATGLALWGLASWTSGLVAYEVIAWSILLYCLCYALFSWITRYNQVIPVLSVVSLIIIALRIIISL